MLLLFGRPKTCILIAYRPEAPLKASLPLTLAFASALTLASTQLRSQAIAPRHVEGRLRGFVTIRTANGKQIGYGTMTQSVQGDRITGHTSYRFRDGSLDEETSVYSDQKAFTLISDHHIQRGPLFPHPLDLTTNADGDTTNRTVDSSGKPKLETSHIDLPPGTAVVGMMCTLMANLDPATQSLKLPVLSPTQKPRLLHFAITPDGHGTFRIAGARQIASIYRLKTELGGIAGIVAPIVDKQPDDILVWIVEGESPLAIRAIGQLSEGGPLLDIQMAGATFPRRHPKITSRPNGNPTRSPAPREVVPARHEGAFTFPAGSVTVSTDSNEFAASPRTGAYRAPCPRSSGSHGSGKPTSEPSLSSGRSRSIAAAFSDDHNPSSNDGFSITSAHNPP